MFNSKMLSLIPAAFLETMIMMTVTCFFSAIFGLLIGNYLYLVDKKISKKSWFTRLLGLVIDSIRSFPFSIFIIALLPLSKWLLGSSFGMKAAFLPMIFAGTCYFARLCHQTFHTLPKDMLDVAILMGFSKKRPF